jgi:hypothetical protein
VTRDQDALLECQEQDARIERSRRLAPRTLEHSRLLEEALWGEHQLPAGQERERIECLYVAVGAWPQRELGDPDLAIIREALGL